jgi:hypothetical protein
MIVIAKGSIPPPPTNSPRAQCDTAIGVDHNARGSHRRRPGQPPA